MIAIVSNIVHSLLNHQFSRTGFELVPVDGEYRESISHHNSINFIVVIQSLERRFIHISQSDEIGLIISSLDLILDP